MRDNVQGGLNGRASTAVVAVWVVYAVTFRGHRCLFTQKAAALYSCFDLWQERTIAAVAQVSIENQCCREFLVDDEAPQQRRASIKTDIIIAGVLIFKRRGRPRTTPNNA